MQSTSSLDPKRDVCISKALSWVLRHGAMKEGFTLPPDGYISVGRLLDCRCLKSKCTIDDVKRIVANNDKQRFTLRTTENGTLEIRANQGHSITNVVDLELTPIADPAKAENVIHGTYFRFWDSIKKQGLSRGRRNHIHFAPGLPGSSAVVSGIRKSAEIYIYVDLPKAIAAGLLFYLSANNVILSPGNDEGFIKPEYFLRVCRASDFSELSF